MAETYRAPKTVVAEASDETMALATDVRDGCPLTLSQVAEIRDSWTGTAGREWATGVCDKAATRALEMALPLMDEAADEDVLEVEAPEPDLPSRMRSLLADVVSLYLAAHGAHWNVIGPDFTEFHKLFGDIYADVYGSVDPLAENIRKVGAVAPYQLPELCGIRSFTDAALTSDARALAAGLLAANDELLSDLDEVFEAASEANQQGIANFVAERIDAHQTWRWQLSATLGVDAPAEMPDLDDSGESETDSTRTEPIMLEERKSAIASAERFTIDAEVRAAGTDDAPQIVGLVCPFNREATGLPFREQFAPGAFTRALQAGDPVFLLINHDTDGIPLASTASGTMRLREAADGLHMEADLDPANPKAQELISALRRMDITKMSFAFTVAPGGQTREDGLRTITDANLFEVSVVTWPAYDATDVGMRTAESDDDEALTLRHRKLQLAMTQLRLRK